VPADAVRRRFARGRDNFFSLYRPLADTWRLYDASSITGPLLVATGGAERPMKIRAPKTWREAAQGYDDE
jgi:predicted ABC-type ATPase